MIVSEPAWMDWQGGAGMGISRDAVRCQAGQARTALRALLERRV